MRLKLFKDELKNKLYTLMTNLIHCRFYVTKGWFTKRLALIPCRIGY